ncbi:PQQ-binding-like beta-propeller repeat protein [Streptomyces sp. A7024]|uniref:PQQ-binding-like beta-propeller repeat protein n=1 Tax=Streptomyces coryli TaxID=1128680 RepID=A0A6G4TW59_9ACTN|nr:PQQ-binding-like beta-propeller repeat protein [Streptomyces coryli]NGN64012.1 PQQ-binding-like beta-propeller repeat protein [Streptomyces coryli]
MRERLRLALALVVVVALVVTGFLVYEHVTRYHEDTSGPHGDFPRALGSGAPEAPARVLRTLPDDTSGIVGGLSVSSDGKGVGTVNVRTGKEFWRYDREETTAGDVDFDRRTVAQWWDDGVLVGLDIRTGKPRWHADAPDTSPIVRILDGQVVTITRREVAAYDEDSGKRLWRTRLPKGCKPDDDGIYAMAGVDTLKVHDCEGGFGRLGLDRRTGAVRWRIQDQSLLSRQLDADTLVWEEAGLVRADLSRTRPVLHPEARFPGDSRLTEASDGVLLTVRDAKSGKDEDEVLEGRAARGDYPVRWTRRPAPGKRLSLPLVADGKVYVVQQRPLSRSDKGQPGPAELLVLNADTGRLLHTTRLPVLKPTSGDYSGNSGQILPWQAQDDLVALRWDGQFSATTERIMLLTTK